MRKVCETLIFGAVIAALFSGCNLPISDTSNLIDRRQEQDIQSEGEIDPFDEASSSTALEAEGSRIPLIFSHGGAPCDIDALVYFSMHPDVDLIGMALTRGEFRPDEALEEWSAFLYDVLGETDTRIALGSDERMDPDSHEFPEDWRVLADNFWNIPLPAATFQYDLEFGPDMIVDLVNSSPDKVTIVAMASMIDVALAIKQDPGIIDNIEQVVIMGGAFNMPGNLADAPYPISNEVAEWNIWIDATAADYLINSGVNISLVPLDATLYLVQPDDLAYINGIDDPRVAFVGQIWSTQLGWWPSGFLAWDTVTAVAVTNPEFFDWVYDRIEVITESGDFQGQTIALGTGSEKVRYAVDANYNGIMDVLFFIYGQPQVQNDLGVITELAGVWYGDTGAYTITFHLNDECLLDQVCGTFYIPEFPLSGDVTIVHIVGDRYEFKASNMSPDGQAAAYEYLELLPDGTMHYYTTDLDYTNEAILTRQ
jgi:inosine-uridine nucleoside N-ribohydrolase